MYMVILVVLNNKFPLANADIKTLGLKSVFSIMQLSPGILGVAELFLLSQILCSDFIHCKKCCRTRHMFILIIIINSVIPRNPLVLRLNSFRT